MSNWLASTIKLQELSVSNLITLNMGAYKLYSEEAYHSPDPPIVCIRTYYVLGFFFFLLLAGVHSKHAEEKKFQRVCTLSKESVCNKTFLQAFYTYHQW